MKKKYNNLNDVRNAIDKLDDKILPLMIKRSQLVENALELKKLKKSLYPIIRSASLPNGLFLWSISITFLSKY